MAEPIRNKVRVTPTPQNTPASVSTLQSQTPLAHGRPGMASISEAAGTESAALLDLIQGRLGNLTGLTSGYIESLPKSVKDRVAALKGLRARQAKIEGDFQRELLELEKKYNTLQQPLYKQRRQLIVGEAEPNQEDVERGEAAFEEEKELFDDVSEDEEDEDEEDAEEASRSSAGSTRTPQAASDDDCAEAEQEEEPVTGVPNFWLTAFRNVPHLTEMISDRDAEVLETLVDVRLRYFDKPGFTLDFEFADNAAFTNRVLSKTYFYREEIGLSGEYMFDHAEGTDIKWVSPEANVTIRVEKRKQRNKHTNATRTIEKTLPEQSFFNFFSPPKIPDADDEAGDDDEYIQGLHAELELDFELGEFFKEKLVPRAVDWFTGRAIDYEGLGVADDEDEDEDDEELDDEDAEDAEDTTEDTVEGMKKEVPENCKQQ